MTDGAEDSAPINTNSDLPAPQARRGRGSPLHSSIRRRIEEYIDAAGLGPGDRLPGERTLAAELGVSRTSLRQALGTLAGSGVVRVVHGSGVYLTDVSPGRAARQLATALVHHTRDLPDVVPVRGALESLAARLAATERSPAHLDRLERALRGMAAELAAGRDGERYSLAFHKAVWSASRNKVLQDILLSLQPGLDRLRKESLAQPDAVALAVVAHRRIFELIRDRDADGAAEAMAHHIHEAADAPLARPLAPEQREPR
ncbi:FadR/GntR family transcriptional regulator [Spirillospora sp. CA-255316]